MEFRTYTRKPQPSDEVQAIKWESVDQAEKICKMIDGAHEINEDKHSIVYSPLKNGATRTVFLGDYIIKDHNGVFWDEDGGDFEATNEAKYVT